MKKVTLTIFILSTLIFSACSNKTFFEFEFDNFYWYFFTENNFTNSKADTNGLWYTIIKDDIIKTYYQTNNSGHKDNIIIIKKQTNKTLKQFVEDLSKTNKIEWYKVDKIKWFDLRCNEEKLQWYTLNAKLIWNLTTSYLNHSFFEYNGYVYIVSFFSDNESERNTFATDAKNIKCKK